VGVAPRVSSPLPPDPTRVRRAPQGRRRSAIAREDVSGTLHHSLQTPDGGVVVLPASAAGRRPHSNVFRRGISYRSQSVDSLFRLGFFILWLESLWYQYLGHLRILLEG
jgi:hypothetical protein